MIEAARHHGRRIAWAIMLACIGLLGEQSPTQAGEYGQAPVPEVARVEFLPGWETESGTRMAGLRIRLAPGWKTYWRAPGDAGIPPSFDWSGSANIAGVKLHWPTPELIRQNGLTTIGYKDEVILPLELAPERPGPISVRATVELGVCESICMPMTVELSADLEERSVPDARIAAALARRPLSAAAAGVQAVRCTVEEIADGLRVTARVDVPPIGTAREEVAIFELPDRAIWISEAETHREGQTLVATAEIVPPFARPFPLDPQELRITLLAPAGRAVDIRGCTG